MGWDMVKHGWDRPDTIDLIPFVCIRVYASDLSHPTGHYGTANPPVKHASDMNGMMMHRLKRRECQHVAQAADGNHGSE